MIDFWGAGFASPKTWAFFRRLHAPDTGCANCARLAETARKPPVSPSPIFSNDEGPLLEPSPLRPRRLHLSRNRGPHRSDFRQHNRAPEQKPEGISVTTFLRASSTGRTATTRKPFCVTRVSSGPLWLSSRGGGPPWGIGRDLADKSSSPTTQHSIRVVTGTRSAPVSRNALEASALLLSVCPDVRSVAVDKMPRRNQWAKGRFLNLIPVASGPIQSAIPQEGLQRFCHHARFKWTTLDGRVPRSVSRRQL